MGCIQYCQRSSHLALSRCCKTENVQGTLRHTPNRQTAGKDEFQQSSRTELVIWEKTSGWTAVVKSRNTEHRRHSTAPSRGVSVTKNTAGTGIHYLTLYQTILASNQSSHVLLLLDIFQPHMRFSKTIFRGTYVYQSQPPETVNHQATANSHPSAGFGWVWETLSPPWQGSLGL